MDEASCMLQFVLFLLMNEIIFYHLETKVLLHSSLILPLHYNRVSDSGSLQPRTKG